MTNKEKYPKTEDALKQYHDEHYNGSFVKWANDEAKDWHEAVKDWKPHFKGLTDPSLAGGIMGLAALVAPLVASRSQERGKHTHVKIEVDISDGAPTPSTLKD